jgi:hypothetical protein
MSCQYRPEILTDAYGRDELAKYYGELWLENLGTMVDRMIDARERLAGARIHDLHYEEFVRDPIAAVRRTYESFDEPFDARLEKTMRDHLRSNPGDRFGARRFEMEEFALTEAAIRRRFERYEARFEVARGV